MKKRTVNEANQPELGFYIPVVVVPQGGGEYLVKPGKAVQWLSPADVAKEFTVDRDSVYRWRSEGIIPESFVRHQGRRKIQFKAEVIEYLRQKFAEER